MDDLSKLRRHLDEIDSKLVDTISQRNRIVEKIQKEKNKTKHALFDRAREREVFQKIRRKAEDRKLNPKLIESIFHLLLEESHRLQQDGNTSKEKRKILVVGGKGQMGRFFAHLFSKRGHSVDVVDKQDRITQRKINKYEIVLLAVPMKTVNKISKEIVPMVSEKGLILDINSLKIEICKNLRECKGEAMGTHPMFGPTVQSPRRQKIVICEIKNGPLSDWFVQELGQMGFVTIFSTPEEHDEMMSIIQVLTHLHVLILGNTLKNIGKNLQSTLKFTSPIYRLELALTGRIFAQDPKLYAAIEMLNPFSKNVRKHYFQAAKQMTEIIEKNDEKDFCNLFNEISTYFEDFKVEAMDLSNEIIDRLVAKP